MARLINIFGFRGKLGNVVGYNYKGKSCVRRLPTRKKSTVSPAQVIQRAKFATGSKFVHSLAGLFAISIRNTNKISPTGYVLSQVLSHAITGDYPNFGIDYSKVPVSCGRLCNAWDVEVKADKRYIIFSWKDLKPLNANPRDKSILVVYCEALDECIYTTEGTERGIGSATLDVSIFRGQVVHTWLSFISPNEKFAANSMYTGALFIT